MQFFKDYRKTGVQDGKKRTHWANEIPLRVADDGTAAVAQEGLPGSQDLYVLASRLPQINNSLMSVHAPFQLVSSEDTVQGAMPSDLDGPQQTLVRVRPVDTANPKKTMAIPDDCGNAARTVTGAIAEKKNLKAEYTGQTGRKTVNEKYDPEMMKYEIMAHHFSDKIPNLKQVLKKTQRVLATVYKLSLIVHPYERELRELTDMLDRAGSEARAANRKLIAFRAAHAAHVATLSHSTDPNNAAQIKAAEAEANAKEKELQEHLNHARDTYEEASKMWKTLLNQQIEGKTLGEIIRELEEAWKERAGLEASIMGPYDAMGKSEQEGFDEQVGINRYANPDVGEAYTISSGGRAKNPDKSMWNFHWGGVIFKSSTGSDSITMENYAGNSTRNWFFQMYGVPSKEDPRAGQTFHEQHRDLHEQHGTRPTTLSTGKH
jgi:hypothetical protein